MAPRKKVCASPAAGRGGPRGCQHGWLTPRPRPGASGRPQGWHGTADAPGQWHGTGRRAAGEGAALRGIAIGKEPCSACHVLRTQEEEKEPPHFWFPSPGDGYALGEVLHHDQDTDNMNVRLKLEAGPKVRTRQSSLRACLLHQAPFALACAERKLPPLCGEAGEPGKPQRSRRQHAADAPARAIPALQYPLSIRQEPHLHLHRRGARIPHRPSVVQALAADPTAELAQATS